MDQENDEDDMPGPPPTPAIQHYYPSSSSQSNKSQQNKSSANSILKTSSFDASSSSASSQYAPQHPPPLGPNGMPTIKHGFLPPVGKPHLPSSGSTGSMSLGDGSSPISPAMMIGGDHEPMMLPPPESQAAAKARASHLEWLRQINALAQANNTNGIAALASQAQASPMPATYGMVPNGSVGMAPPHQHQANIQVPTNMAQQHQHQQHQPPTLATFPPPGVALHPTAAAALAAANNPLFFSHAAAILRHHASSPVETEEKRAKRLERNRESARKSRRRKKERLNNLEGKVNAMHNRIDKERRIQINSMEKVLGEHEQERILQLVEEYSNQEGDDTRDERLGNALSHLLSSTNEFTIRKDIVEFQYTTLSQYLLPRYQKFLLWLVLQPDSFFTVGKEEHTKREAEQNIPRGTSGKISSKQIGDELTNGRKLENGKFIPPPPPPEYAQQHHLQQQSDSGEKNNPVAQAFDAGRMWPLTCFELSISVDQEDRFLSALKR
jgi:bZIP transcription factor